MRAWALCAAALWLAACREAPESAPEPRSAAVDESAVDFESLRSLGYVDFTEPEAAGATTSEPEIGLVYARPDPDRGDTLVVSIPHCVADLVGP